MEDKEYTDTPTEDAKVTALLSLLHQELTPEEDFEARFLADFERRLAEEQPQVSILSRCRQFCASVWRNKTVWGTSCAAALVIGVAYVAWIPSADEAALASNQVQTNNAAAQIGHVGLRSVAEPAARRSSLGVDAMGPALRASESAAFNSLADDAEVSVEEEGETPEETPAEVPAESAN